MPTTRSDEGIGFQDKDTINLEELSNTNGYLPMVQSGINYKVRPTELKRDAVAVCSSSADTVTKVATVNNMPDFVLVNGTVITVYFENKNTAAEPTLNINNTGSWPLKLPNQANNISIGSGCWNDGFIAEVKYVEISDNNKFFLLLGHNVASTNNNYTTLADGTTIYSKAQTDNTIDTKLESYPTSEEVNTKLEDYDNKGEVDSKINGALANYVSLEKQSTVLDIKEYLNTLPMNKQGLAYAPVSNLGDITQGYLWALIQYNKIEFGGTNHLGNATVYMADGRIFSYKLNNDNTWSFVGRLTIGSELTPQGVSGIFTLNSNFNLTDVKIYSNSNLVNIQRLIITPKNAITTSSIYVIGILSSYRPKQVTRFTAYVNHKGIEGYIEPNGNVVVYLESGTSGSIICDNLMYFY